MGLRLVWWLKYRRRGLGGRAASLCGHVLDAVAVEHCGVIVAKEVMPDQVDLFVRVDSIDAPGQVVRAFKARITRVLGQEFPYLRRFAWSPSNFAVSVGDVLEVTVRDYLAHRWVKVAS